MANTVIALKKSATPSAAPAALANGELALNYADGKLYYKHANGTIASISGNEPNYFGTVNANSVLIVSDTPGDILSITPGNNISIVGDAVNDSVTIGLKDDVTVPGLLSITAASGDEGGEIRLANAITNSLLAGPVNIDIFRNQLRFFVSGGDARGAFINLASTSAGVGTDLLASSTDAVARTTANAAFDKANAALPNVSGTWFNGTLTASVSFAADKIVSSNNGNSENFKVGDDAWIGDYNTANSLKVKGQQNSSIGYISFGIDDAKALGRAGTGPLTYDGSTVWHAGNDGTGSTLDADLLDGQHGSYYGTATDVTAAFAKANAANLLAFNTGAGANAYAQAVGTAGNSYTVTVGAAANGWANTISDTRAIASNAYAEAVGTAGNVYAEAVGTAGNVYAREVGTAGNSYTVTVGAASNGWANTISATRSTASNAYAETVGTAGNAYTQTVGTAGNSYTQTVGTAGNSYTIIVGAAANGWANSVSVDAKGYANSTFVKLTASSQTITGDVNIVGTLTLSGNTVIIDATRLEIDDPLIYLAGNNYTSDIVDIGFIANYVNATGSNVHTGLYREHDDKMYYLFQGYDKEPANNHIGALSNNMTLAVLNADLRTSNLTLAGTNTVVWIRSSYDQANTARTHANTAFAKANSALANTSDVSFNGNLNFPTGNVGIGTTSPVVKLVVSNAGAQGFEFNPNSSGLAQIETYNRSTAAYYGFRINADDIRLHTGASATERMRLTAAGDLLVGRTSSSGLGQIQSTIGADLATDSGNVYLVRGGGNVGIGTSSPTETLHINGTTRIDGAGGLRIFKNGSDSISSQLYVADQNNSKAFNWQLNADNSALDFYTYNGSWIRRITYSVDGNVGIGTASPSYTLQVNGSFAATTKSFVIDHPTKPGMKLRYGSLEGPENGVYVRGRVHGPHIYLPDYWKGLVDENSITVSLTPIAKTEMPSVLSYNNEKIVLHSDSPIDCFYHVFGERKDVDKLIVEY